MKKIIALCLVGLFLMAFGCQSASRLERAADRQAKTAEMAKTDMSASEEDSAPQATIPDLSPLTGLARQTVPRLELLDESPLDVGAILPEDVEVLEDAIVVPERRAVMPPEREPSEYPRDLIQGMKDPDEEVVVQFSFDAMSLNEIVPMFARLLDFSYVIDPAVKGAVTMAIDSTMTGEEVWELFEHILWLSGAYASPNPGFVHILPFAKMPTERRLMRKHKPQPNVQVQLVPIYNTTSAEMAGMLQPFMTPGATATNIPRLNSLLLVESPLNVQKLIDLIEVLDAPGEADWPQITIRCNEVDAAVILEELQSLMPILGFPTSNQTPAGGALKMTALPRLQVIVASAALQDVLSEVEKWARMLDRADASDKQDIFFYNVRHRTASQLSDMLDVFFNASTTTAARVSRTDSVAARAQDTTAAARARAMGGGGGVTQPPASPSSRNRNPPDEPQNDSIFETPVIIYVDEVQNRLTIRTTQRAYAVVQALLTRQDVPIRQVMIEAIIAEITLGKNTEFGFAYAAKQGKWRYMYQGREQGITTLLPGLGDAVDDGDDDGGADEEGEEGEAAAAVVNKIYNFAVESALMPSSGATALYMRGDALAFVKAVAGESNTKVISAPQIMAATGEEARIEVGKEIAVRTTEYIGTTTDRTNFEYRNTGTILTVTPYITAGNQVRVDVEQEVSSVIESTRAELESPDISRKNLRTTLSIPDGGTIMMGGLIDTIRGEGHSGIPFLKDIPYLGWLFRSNSRSSGRQELLVLITVNVIDPSAADSTELLARRYQAALDEIKFQFKER